jgi:predicted nucleotidyltransferase
MKIDGLSPERRKTAEYILRRLSPYGAQRIFLFGSFARNRSDELSDIDLLIVKETDEDFFSRMRHVLRLLDLKTAVDVLVYTPEELGRMQEQGNPLIESVLEEGIELHG